MHARVAVASLAPFRFCRWPAGGLTRYRSSRSAVLSTDLGTNLRVGKNESTFSGSSAASVVDSSMRAKLYYGAVVNEEALRARFDVIAIDGEGILLDREGGSIIRLNRTACEIWTAILGGQSIAGASRELARRFGLTADRAARDVALAIDQIPDAPRSPAPTRAAGKQSRPATPSSRDLACCARLTAAEAPCDSPTASVRRKPRRAAYLKSIAPKLLSLRGVFLLHAAAVEIDGKLLVFSGRSGAGKTTSARAFARAGARLVSEDLLVMAAAATSTAEPRAVIGGEAADPSPGSSRKRRSSRARPRRPYPAQRSIAASMARYDPSSRSCWSTPTGGRARHSARTAGASRRAGRLDRERVLRVARRARVASAVRSASRPGRRRGSFPSDDAPRPCAAGNAVRAYRQMATTAS